MFFAKETSSTYLADMHLLQCKIDKMLANTASEKHCVVLGMDGPRDTLLRKYLRERYKALVISEQENKQPYIDCKANYCTLPFDNESASCIVLQHCHALKHYNRSLLREIWRTLDTNGSLLILLPSRPIFLHSYHTLKKESGYRTKQVYTMLHEHFFMVKSIERCFHTPATVRQIPMPSYILQTKTHSVLETSAKFLCPTFAGMLLVMAQKQNVQIIKNTSAKKYKKRASQAVYGSSL